MPESCEKAFAQIGATEDAVSWGAAAAYGVLPAGTKVVKGETLFPRIDAKKMLEELDAIMEEQKKAAAHKQEEKTELPVTNPKPVLPNIPIDEFAKSDMRVCRILSCEAVEGSKKLLKFILDDGTGTPRQILSGIHSWYEPEQLVGKRVVAILNLPDRKMMGQDSNGMLLSAVLETGGKEDLHLMILDDTVPVGGQIC